MLAYFLALILSFAPPPCCLNVSDGEIVEVWYSDDFIWLPTWTPAVVHGNRLDRVDGKGYFDARQVKKHYRWRRGKQ